MPLKQKQKTKNTKLIMALALVGIFTISAGYFYYSHRVSVELPVGQADNPPTMGPPLAFPGCEGEACATAGGRGGDVYVVDDLGSGAKHCTPVNGQASGCTLRDCLEARGPRTCVFNTSGTIYISSNPDDHFGIVNPYITIAGQTALNGGITLTGITPTTTSSGNLLNIGGHDVVMRYLRFRAGSRYCNQDEYNGNLSFNEPSAMGGGGPPYDPNKYWLGRVVVDHNSGSYSGDDNMWLGGYWYGSSDITFSWNLLGEGGNTKNGDPNQVQCQNTNFCVGSANTHQDCIDRHLYPDYCGRCDTPTGCAQWMTNYDFHHNAFVGDTHRNPTGGTAGPTRYVSNIMSPIGGYGDTKAGGPAWGGAQISDVINNYINAQNDRPYDIIVESPLLGGDIGTSGTPSIFLSGNASTASSSRTNCPAPSYICANQRKILWQADEANYNVCGDLGCYHYNVCNIDSDCTGGRVCTPLTGCAFRGDGAWANGWFTRTSKIPIATPGAEITQDSADSLDNLLFVTGRTIDPANYGPAGASRRLTCQGAMMADQDLFDQSLYVRYKNKSSATLNGDGEEDPNLGNGRWSIVLKDILARAQSAKPCTWINGLPQEWVNGWAATKTITGGANGHNFDPNYTNLEAYLSGLFPTPTIATYTITASAGPNGTISPSGSVTVKSGASQIFTITPNTGYSASLTVDGSPAGMVSTVGQASGYSYIFSGVTADHTIVASFAEASDGGDGGSYIHVTAGANGTISPSGPVTVKSGASKTFTITPNSGYKVSSVLIDGKSVGAVTSYTLSNIKASHTISASFAAITPLTCTSFTYSAWGACQPNNTQTRTVTSSTPTGCTGGNPVLTQSCAYSNTCTSFTYSAWGACKNKTRTRGVLTSSPQGCSGGNPVLTKSCSCFLWWCS